MVNAWNGIKDNVCDHSSCTNPSAGLSPSTFSNPNQKYTAKNETLASGIQILARNFKVLFSNVAITTFANEGKVKKA